MLLTEFDAELHDKGTFAYTIIRIIKRFGVFVRAASLVQGWMLLMEGQCQSRIHLLILGSRY